jgi:Spy/CpxP family protein refolding chaperone
MQHGVGPGPGGKWWDNPEMARRVGITSDQKKKMDDVFTQGRLKLIDLRAALEKDEVQIEALMQGPQLDDSKILPMIDRIAQDRAELEKADARLLLGIRHILTPEQWTTLNQGDEHGPNGGGRGPGGPGHGAPGGPGSPPPPPRE